MSEKIGFLQLISKIRVNTFMFKNNNMRYLPVLLVFLSTILNIFRNLSAKSILKLKKQMVYSHQTIFLYYRGKENPEKNNPVSKYFFDQSRVFFLTRKMLQFCCKALISKSSREFFL